MIKMRHNNPVNDAGVNRLTLSDHTISSTCLVYYIDTQQTTITDEHFRNPQKVQVISSSILCMKKWNVFGQVLKC